MAEELNIATEEAATEKTARQDPVDRELLVASMSRVALNLDALARRKDSDKPAQTAYLKAVAEDYNKNKPAGAKSISFTQVRLRIGDWALDHPCEPQVKKLIRKPVK